MGNVILVPAFMVGTCVWLDQDISWWFALTCVPMCGLLLIGGLYWRAKLHQLEGRKDTLRRFLPIASIVQWPFAFASTGALVIGTGAWSINLGASTGDRVIIAIAAVLAVLEHINYYHRQLQHFDHWPDLKRLLTGRGFQPSQMAVDLKRYRLSKLRSGKA